MSAKLQLNRTQRSDSNLPIAQLSADRPSDSKIGEPKKKSCNSNNNNI